MGGIEEKIYRRQVYKKGMNLQTIETGEAATAENEVDEQKAFEKYFGDSDLFELFEFNQDDRCDTLDLIMKKDGFNYDHTPTNDSHVQFLEGLPQVKGLSLNSNLYTTQEREP
mmetsp:Transcript_30241/g.46237  ORF Transcript_30241/g.46237 Transcript_30241/m.46237 type:complete len:113 (-) Transcript_30241:239-577(-)